MRMDRCAGRLRGIVAGIRQMRRSGLQLGRGCLGTDARLRGDHDAVCLYVQKVLNKAEWLRRKPNELHNKNNCFSMIYEQIENYNLS